MTFIAELANASSKKLNKFFFSFCGVDGFSATQKQNFALDITKPRTESFSLKKIFALLSNKNLQCSQCQTEIKNSS